jgi:chaperonin GroES
MRMRMRIRQGYIVVRKTSGDSGFYVSKQFVDEHQMCEVVDTPEGFDIQPGETIFVGKNISFDPVPDSDCFYIDHAEIFGYISGNRIIPMKDVVYIKANKHAKSEIEVAGIKMYQDTSYDPMASHNVVQDGQVFTICEKAHHSVLGHEIEIEVSEGDHVYSHHFLTDESRERVFGTKTYYEVRYEELYCKIENEQVIMLNDWNFVSPVEATGNVHENGIIMELNKKNQLRVGVIEVPNKDLGLEKGEMVYFKKGREYEIDVEGTNYYRIRTNDILCKFNSMKARGKIVIVKPIEKDNMIGNFIETVAQGQIPERGEVLAMGSDVPDLSVGDEVLFRKLANSEVEIDGEKVLLMEEKNVYAVV